MPQDTSVLAYRIRSLELEIEAFKATGEHNASIGGRKYLIDLELELAHLVKEYEASQALSMNFFTRTLIALSKWLKRPK